MDEADVSDLGIDVAQNKDRLRQVKEELEKLNEQLSRCWCAMRMRRSGWRG